MGQAMGKARPMGALRGWHRALMLLLLAAWLRRKVGSFVAGLVEQHRRHKLLRALPGPKSGPYELLGAVSKLVPEGMALTHDNLYVHLINQLDKIVRHPDHADEGLVVMWVLNERIPGHALGRVFVHDAGLAKELLATRNLDDYNKGRSYTISRPLIGHGVLSTSGSAWSPQRAILDKGFKPDIISANMDRIMQTATEHCERIQELLRQNQQQQQQQQQQQRADHDGGLVVNVHEEMLKVTLDVLGRVAFSYDIGSVTAPTTRDAPLFHAFENIIRSLEMRIRNPLLHRTRRWPLPPHNRFNADMAKLEAVVDDIIEDRLAKKRDAQSGTDRTVDLLDVMLKGLTSEEEAQHRAGGMSRQTMADNIKTLLFAGHDTTAAASTWFLQLLAEHPEAAERIREEALELLGSLTAVPDLEKLERMPYLNACVLEVLRLYPSAAFTRTPKRDVQLGKYCIPEGTEMLVFPYYIHRDPRNYERPNEFVPERWMQDRAGAEQLSLQAQLAKETRTKAYLPFSLGKRNCVGRPLALVEIRLIILRILADFDVSLPTAAQLEGVTGFKHRPWPAMSLTLNPMGVNLLYTPRRAAAS